MLRSEAGACCQCWCIAGSAATTPPRPSARCVSVHRCHPGALQAYCYAPAPAEAGGTSPEAGVNASANDLRSIVDVHGPCVTHAVYLVSWTCTGCQAMQEHAGPCRLRCWMAARTHLSQSSLNCAGAMPWLTSLKRLTARLSSGSRPNMRSPTICEASSEQDAVRWMIPSPQPQNGGTTVGEAGGWCSAVTVRLWLGPGPSAQNGGSVRNCSACMLSVTCSWPQLNAAMHTVPCCKLVATVCSSSTAAAAHLDIWRWEDSPQHELALSIVCLDQHLVHHYVLGPLQSIPMQGDLCAVEVRQVESCACAAVC
jgi:hypothetical protein